MITADCVQMLMLCFIRILPYSMYLGSFINSSWISKNNSWGHNIGCQTVAAPCDYFLWGHLENKLNKQRVSMLRGLQKAIIEKVKKKPQEIILRALKSRTKHCRQIYYANRQAEKHCWICEITFGNKNLPKCSPYFFSTLKHALLVQC